MLTVTKRFEFCYGHYLPSYSGKCRNMHGHNSVVEVEIAKSPPGSAVYNGMIMDFSDIKGIAGGIIDELDHRCLNEHEQFIQFCQSNSIQFLSKESGWNQPTVIPTAEIICQYLVYRIRQEIPGLVRLRVTETSDSWAEWKWEGPVK